MKYAITKVTAALVALVVTVSLGLVAGAGSAGAGAAQRGSDPTTARVIADNALGSATSRIRGTTASGDRVTGWFEPRKFVKRDGKLKVRGIIHGVVKDNGRVVDRFTAKRTLKVKSINGTPVRAGRPMAGLAVCDILHLTLGPLDLDLLGLKVHLDRVVLDIVAESGPGNLLGNLLCAVAGLLDGGLGGLLGQLRDLLNQILGALGLR